MDVCIECKFRKIERRSLYCNTCYARLLRQGKILKIEKSLVPDSFSEEQKNIIIGSLLGDGCIFKYKATHTPYFCILRKATDDKYLIWEYEKFKDFCASPPKYRTTLDERTNKEYFSVKFITRRINLLNEYYDLWYPNGIKIVPSNLKLTPLICAIWFCDDGCIVPSSSPWRMRLKLSTHGFTLDEVEFLRSSLQERYHEKFPIILEKNNDKIRSFITGSDNATRAFLQEIDPVFPESMLRKAYWRNEEANFYTNQPKRTTVWNQK